MQYFIKGMKNYVNFNGRATRTEYWMFYLFYILFYFVAYGILMAGLFAQNDVVTILGSVLVIGFVLATMLPMWAVSIRRLHDVGKSGWFILVNLIPFAGPIWFLVLMCTDSQPGTNQYGDNPKGM